MCITMNPASPTYWEDKFFRKSLEDFRIKEFRLYIKSHSEESDLDIVVKARHKIEALNKIRNSPIVKEFPIEVLAEHIEEI